MYCIAPQDVDDDFGNVEDEEDESDDPNYDKDDLEYYELGTASEDGSFASFYHR